MKPSTEGRSDWQATATGDHRTSVVCLHADESVLAELRSELTETNPDLEVTTAESIDDATGSLSDAQVDCLLVGDRFPDGDAVDLIEVVRRVDPSLPVIVFAADATLARRAMRAGAAGWFAPEEVDLPKRLATHIIESAATHRAERHYRTRYEQQAAVAELGQLALAGDPLQGLFDAAVETVADLLDDEYTKVLELLPDGEGVFLRAGVGWNPGLVGEAVVPIGLDSQAGYTLQSAAPVIVEDLRTETRFSGPKLLHDHGVISGISVIIGTVEEPWGVFGTHSSRRKRFTGDDIAFVQSVATVLAMAIERHETEAALEAAEARGRTILDRLLDTSPVGVVLLDDRGDITRANARAATLFGVTTETLRGRSYDDPAWTVLDTDGEPSTFDALPAGAVLEGDSPSRSEHGIRRADGVVEWVSVDAAPLTGLDEADAAAIVVLTDITEHRLRENVLRAQNERLDEFAAIISHDLRNPLAVLDGSLQLARETDDPTPHLERCERATERMSRLVTDLLTLARQGRPVEVTERHSLSQLARTVWDRIDHRGTLVVDDDTIAADPSRLEQLFENLFRNAVTHGGEDVTVRIGPLPDGFFVEDDGPGIPAEVGDRVFQHGYTTHQQGSGFGLTIVKRIAEAHGWTVRLGEAETGGARFEFHGVAG